MTNISGTFTNKGGLVFPANNQTLVYDADGNLISDGIWTYQWDGENRLVSMTMTNVSGIANSNRLKLDFAYDYLGRRVQKIVSTNSGSAFVPQSTNRFVYDGWNLLAILNPQSSILASFAWGQDIVGAEPGDQGEQSGCGVGGLLMANFSGTNCFTTFDGNGNITALINATDRSVSARYEYSPYGEPIRATGLFARQNPFRFSTKFWDEESGLINYERRFYNPSLGRWLNRDLLAYDASKEHRALLKEYVFVDNNPLCVVDVNGLWGVMVGGYLIGYGAPNYDFDFDKSDCKGKGVSKGK